MLFISKGQLLSHNLFAYCLNDPVFKSDPNGLMAQTEIVGVDAERLIIETNRRKIRKELSGTNHVGFQVSVCFLFGGVTLQHNIVWDEYGNICGQDTYGFRVLGCPGFSAGFLGGNTTASNVQELNGVSNTTGGSVIVAGADYLSNATSYNGKEGYIGVGWPIPLDAHTDICYTKTNWCFKDTGSFWWNAWGVIVCEYTGSSGAKIVNSIPWTAIIK
jgi:hypothetical protein